MSALYWQDLDCDELSRSIEHEATVHEHFTSEQRACVAFLAYRTATPMESGVPPLDMRFRCIRGPRGLVRGVRL